MKAALPSATRARPQPGRPSAIAPAASGRIAAIDALRGLAIVAMVGYHFCFDLSHFGLAAWDFHRDPFWLHARTLILSSFLLLGGISLVLAETTGDSHRRFWRHVMRIAACAIIVSVASFALFPRSYIWFGVLHAIAVSLVLVRPLTRRPMLALALGIAVIAAGTTLSASWFDSRTWGWIGFMTAKPMTEDYVPLFPWTGVVLVGIACGAILIRDGFRSVRAFARLPAPIAWLGRHSLAVYMIHQPLLFAALYTVTQR